MLGMILRYAGIGGYLFLSVISQATAAAIAWPVALLVLLMLFLDRQWERRHHRGR
jgi:hypothetical protein